MTSAPRVWWNRKSKLFVGHNDTAGGDFCTEVFWYTDGSVDIGDDTEAPPADAAPLVPQADRDELREAISFVVYHCAEEMCEPDIPDRVMAVLADRGLVGGDSS